MRCIKCEGLKSVIVESEEDPRAVKAPLLHLALIENFNNSLVQSSLFPLCPMKESIKAYLYPSGEQSESDFIRQSIMAAMKDRMSVPPSIILGQEFFKLHKNVESFPKFSKALAIR